MSDTLTLERRVYNVLTTSGPQDPIGIAVALDYPLSATAEDDREFFDVLKKLEESGRVESYPRVEENPGLSLEHQNNPYLGRIYGAALWPSRNSRVGRWLRCHHLL